MKNELDNKELVKHFLLGDLSESEHAEIEDHFLANDDFFQELLIGEDDLIDAYVRGELPATERALFERCYLSTQSERERIEFAQSLFNSVSGKDATAAVATTREPDRTVSPAWWRSLFDMLRLRRPALGFTLAAALLMFALGGLWLLRERTRDTPEPEQASQITPLPTSESTSSNAPVAQETLSREKETPTSAPSSGTPKKNSPTSSVIATYALLPGMVRSESGANPLVLSGAVTEVRLRLILEDEEYKQYRATLSTAEGRKVWDRVVTNRTSKNSANLTFRLPADLLKSGDYVLDLSGAHADGKWESIADYSFRVVKK